LSIAQTAVIESYGKMLSWCLEKERKWVFLWENRSSNGKIGERKHSDFVGSKLFSNLINIGKRGGFLIFCDQNSTFDIFMRIFLRLNPPVFK